MGILLLYGQVHHSESIGGCEMAAAMLHQRQGQGQQLSSSSVCFMLHASANVVGEGWRVAWRGVACMVGVQKSGLGQLTVCPLSVGESRASRAGVKYSAFRHRPGGY